MKKYNRYCLIIYAFMFSINLFSFTVTSSSKHKLYLKLSSTVAINFFKSYFINYYQNVGNGKAKDQKTVLKNIKRFLKKYSYRSTEKQKIKAINNFLGLTLYLNQRFEKQQFGINIFTDPEYNIVNCWLGREVNIKKSIINVWSKYIKYTLISIDKIILRDFLYYYTKGEESFQLMTKDNIIFCNKEAIRKKALERWNLLTLRDLANGNYKKYNSSQTDKLRKKLLIKAWKNSYLNSKKKKKVFLRKVEQILLKVALIHEVGHIYAEKFIKDKSDKNSEIIALKTELKFGGKPFESLNTVLSFAWKSPWDSYRYAGQYIIKGILKQIKLGKLGNDFQKQLYILERRHKKKLFFLQNVFYFLKKDDIVFVVSI